MNSSIMRRLVLILAAADVKRSDIFELYDALAEVGPETLWLAVRDISHQSESFDPLRQQSRPRVSEHSRPTPRRTTSSSAKISARIESLLRDEARLGVDEAAALLIGAFPEARGIVPANPGKIGLRRWLERLLEIVPESLMLQFLETYLGTRRSGGETDWKLGRS